jgi:hypothetical protein
LKHLVFWGLFGLVLFGVLLTLFQNRRQHLRRTAEHDDLPSLMPLGDGRAEPALPAAAVAPAAPAAPASRAAEQPAPYDPTATRIYARPEPVSAPVDNLARAGADKPLQGTPKLICLGGRLKGRQFPISGIGLSIGRAGDNDVIIVDGRVSSHHAWIGVVNGRAILRDYQSLNGTFLNADMDTPVSEAALLAGDTIFFGGHGGDQYRFVVE